MLKHHQLVGTYGLLSLMLLLFGCAKEIGDGTQGNGADRNGRVADCLEEQIEGQTLALTSKQSFYENNETYVTLSPGVPWQISSPVEQKVDESLLRDGELVLEKTPSVLSFLVVRHGYLVRESYFHGSAANHSNNIHSVSKGLLSALVGMGIEKGQLPGVHATLSQMLPKLRFDDPAKANITLRDLLTMTAGFSWEEDETEYEIEHRPDWVQAIVDRPLVRTPGSKFNYSTGQSHLVSAILTEATGKSTMQYAMDHIFTPLGITVEHWGKDPQSYNSGGYNLYITPRSLAKLGQLFLRKGELDGRRIIPEAWVEESMRSQVRVDRDYEYGYYWWLTNLCGYDVRILWGYGGQMVYVIPDLDAVVVITNNTYDEFEEWDGDSFLERYVLPAIQPTKP